MFIQMDFRFTRDFKTDRWQPLSQNSFMRSRKPSNIVCLLLALALTSPVFATSALSEKSPFLPPGHGVKPQEPTRAPVPTQGPISRELEFRGVISMGGKRQFSIFNKKAKKGYWIADSQTVEGIQVRDYDTSSSTVVVNMNGRAERLTMMTATESPLPVAASKSPTRTAAPTAPPGLPNLEQPQKKDTNRRVIPRRRVILPNQNK